MEEGCESALCESALSRFLQRFCLTLARSKRLECVGSRGWKYVVVGLMIAFCASVFFASLSFSHKQSLECSSSVISLLRTSRSSGSRLVVDGRTGDFIIQRRQLLAQDGDYETVPLIEKAGKDRTQDPESAALLGEGAKEPENHSLLDKVANAEDDYENLALTGEVTSESEVQVLDGRQKQRIKGGDRDARAAMGEQTEMDEDGATAKDANKAEHRGVEKLLDRMEESVGNEEDGRFNKTISEQDGVLETVARVGGRSFEDEEEEEPSESEKEALRLIGLEILGSKGKEVTDSDEEAGPVENSKHLGETDRTWLDRVMGQSDQPYKLEPPYSLMKDSSRDPGSNQSVVSQTRNSTKEKPIEDNAGYHQVEDVPRLIDREDNEYVISNPGKNRMMLQEDLTLISDIVMVIVTAALGGTFCGLLGQPVILGYLAAGMVVGPGGLHLVHELVQVETLAQLGVVFLLFVLGVEFNPLKMQGIHKVTLGGGCLQIFTAMLLGGLLGSSMHQGLFIGAFLSMSSTAVVVKCLMDSNMGGTEHGRIMLGTLILQDCALGLLLAIMPALAANGSGAETFAFAITRAAVSLLMFCAFAWLLARFFIPRFLCALVQVTKFNSDLFLLGAIGVCLSMALLSQTLGLSLEVGAFVGGLVLSGGTHTEKTLHQLEPIRNVFAALFLASIGMVMHPVFLWEHIDILMASLGIVFVGKTCLFALVVWAFGYSGKTSVSVGVALAQIGEFAFILLSRAQSLHLVSKKLYLLLMGTSALSLVLTPFAFKIVIRINPPGQLVSWKAASKPAHNHDGHVPGNVNQAALKGILRPYSLDPTFVNNMGSELASNMFSSDLAGPEEHVELCNMENGRGDSSQSPGRVVLRRPQGLGGNWKKWRKELVASEVYDRI